MAVTRIIKLVEKWVRYRQAIVVAMNQTYLMELMLGVAKPELTYDATEILYFGVMITCSMLFIQPKFGIG
jgi:hypothetical protein